MDVYLLNQEQWIKVLSTPEIESIFDNQVVLTSHAPDIVYKLNKIPKNDYLERLIGIVSDNSVIGKIRFAFNSKVQISEGQLLEVNVHSAKVLYQITEGIAKIEQLESKNQTGYIIGEAIQLGTWNVEKLKFEQFGWVPDINTPVYYASRIPSVAVQPTEYQIGVIPNTNYPVIINKAIAITHHTAILGVTGTGKSTFARNLITQFITDPDTKVICIDFTKEYAGKFPAINPQNIVDGVRAKTIFKCIDFLVAEYEKFPNQQNKVLIQKAEAKLKRNFYRSMIEFLNGPQQLTIFELPDVANTQGILEYTRYFFKCLFQIARDRRNYSKRICVVLEEAHTVIPEWNFIGLSDKSSQTLVNNIGQIALQGRKYDIGFLLIAQRTANVSKTVLTQCNSIIAFQEFDKTSSEFLSNYFGDNVGRILPNLKFRQAIAAGKAFRSNVPMIFEIPELTT